MNSESRVGNLYEKIASAALDEAVGIQLAHLTGDESFSFFGAEIAPRKKIAAHYHRNGLEIYQVVQGDGIMYIGNRDDHGGIVWNQPFQIGRGDCFTVQAGEAHQLYNTADHPMVVVFGCSKTHLAGDRYVVEGFNRI